MAIERVSILDDLKDDLQLDVQKQINQQIQLAEASWYPVLKEYRELKKNLSYLQNQLLYVATTPKERQDLKFQIDTIKEKMDQPIYDCCR